MFHPILCSQQLLLRIHDKILIAICRSESWGSVGEVVSAKSHHELMQLRSLESYFFLFALYLFKHLKIILTMFVIQKSILYGKFHIHRTKKYQGNIFRIHPFHRFINPFINSINNLNTFHVPHTPCYMDIKRWGRRHLPTKWFYLRSIFTLLLNMQ